MSCCYTYFWKTSDDHKHRRCSQVFGHAIAKQRTGNGTRVKETEMEQVAVVGQCEGGGIRVASILGRT